MTVSSAHKIRPVPPGHREVFSKAITVKGRRIFAASKGLTAFRFLAKETWSLRFRAGLPCEEVRPARQPPSGLPTCRLLPTFEEDVAREAPVCAVSGPLTSRPRRKQPPGEPSSGRSGRASAQERELLRRDCGASRTAGVLSFAFRSRRARHHVHGARYRPSRRQSRHVWSCRRSVSMV
jgi:hypothetical protein